MSLPAQSTRIAASAWSSPSLALLVEFAIAPDMSLAELIKDMTLDGATRQGGRKRPKDD